MFYCKDCEQWFEETEPLYIEDSQGKIVDSVNTCPLCGSANVEKKEKENVRD